MNFSIKKAVLLSAASLALFTSCRDDNNNNGGGVTAQTTYEFTRNGQSTVNVSGQHQRIDMHSAVKAYADSGKNQDITAAHLMALVQNTGNPFQDGAFYSASDLNGSGKQIWNKLGASSVADQQKVYAYFTELFNELEYLSSQRNQMASNGVAGKLGTAKPRLVNAKGIETIQLMSKSMMGALELDQILNHYLSDAKLNVDNTNMVEGKNYTAMEHHWDEAFGYTGLPLDPSTPTGDDANKPKYGRFWSGYIGAVNNSVAGEGIKQEIYDAFIKGRMAIVNKNYAERNIQRDKLVKLLEKVCLIRAVHYLNAGIPVIQDPNSTADQKATAFHEVSEGLGFLYALEFTPMGVNAPADHKPTFYLDQIKELGLYNTATAEKLTLLSQKLASYGGFNVQDA